MKMREQSIIKGLVMTSAVVASGLVNSDVATINDFLSNINCTPEIANKVMSLVCEGALLSTFYFEKISDDYKDIKKDYDKVIENIAEMIRKLNIQNDPVAVFALYVYLYRSGYLSCFRYFEYDTDMKDLSCLCGLDVVRGTGVCRSISSMFVDICNELDMSATNLCVKVTSKNSAKKKSFASVPLNRTERSSKFVKFVSLLTGVLPLGNHLISKVVCDDKVYIFDPTGDLMLYKGKSFRLDFANNTSAHMSHNYISEIVTGLLSQCKVQLNYLKQKKEFKLPSISYEEYVDTYMKTLELIESNPDLFEEFYIKNYRIFDDIYDKSLDIRGLVRRLLPF